jgi:hypothetical protein
MYWITPVTSACAKVSATIVASSRNPTPREVVRGETLRLTTGGHAAALHNSHPIVAAMMESIAESYDQYAKSEE